MDDALRAELLRRMAKDQIARKVLDLDGMREADSENLPWFRAVIAEHGWPGKSLVGADGANAAWLLAQHADGDPAFQRECLRLLTAAVEAGEATSHELAYLTDRVLLHAGQPQVYGTQMTYRGGTAVPLPLRDPDGVDERRAATGLRPIAEYLREFASLPVPPQLQCTGCGAWVPFEPQGGSEQVTGACLECGRKTTIALAR